MKNKNSDSNFYYAFKLLPAKKREAMKTFYLFSHISDELVDNYQKSIEEKTNDFENWVNEFNKALKGSSSNRLLVNITNIIQEFKIPEKYFIELLDGIKSDLTFRQPETFEDLENYAYSVASTVGLITIHIFGFTNSKAKEFAINLGKALQITNIIRDVKLDFETGRIYIPQELFKKFNYTPEELKEEITNEGFLKIMKSLDELAENFYSEAEKIFPREDYATLYPAIAMGEIYHSLLLKIRKHNYEIFTQKFTLSKIDKLWIVLKHILKGKMSK